MNVKDRNIIYLISTNKQTIKDKPKKKKKRNSFKILEFIQKLQISHGALYIHFISIAKAILFAVTKHKIHITPL